jgi:tetratricopeptide (TPR) repeat protein
VIDEGAKAVRRKFAMETKAQEFAMTWCKRLWSEPFDHPNPVHNPPAPEELADDDPEFSDLLRLTAERPDDAELFQRLARRYRRRGQMTEARAAYERSLELDPSDPWTHLLLGNWYFAQRDEGAAVDWFSRAAALMPDDATPFWCLAEVYEHQGRFDLADENYRRAAEIDPANKSARRKLRSWLEHRAEVGSTVTSP